ncbi:MAG: efflux RND transporter periplasmic adaptor subunit [Chthoniobacterales bacterium]|jgi:cobalt-zinc-cadmium efflux system membrane fusion protein
MKLILAIITVLLFAAAARATPGCQEHPLENAGGEHSDGPIVLTETQASNLGLRTEPAEIAEIAPAVEVPAVLVLPPEKHARINAPFAGRVTELLVKLGDHVTKGQPLMRVTPLAVGSPAQELRAPIDGVVFDQEAVIGLAFTPETTLMHTGDYRELLARGSFYQSPGLTEIKNGQKAVLLLDVFPDEKFTGTVQRVDPGHGEGSPFFHIYAVVPNPDDRLHPNYRARMVVETAPPEPVIAVPRRALLGRLGAKFVYVQTEPLHFERRDVKTGLASGDRVEIVEGLLPGDAVVTNGHYQLQYVLSATSTEPHGDEHGHAH